MLEISIKAEHLFELWRIPVTNSMLLAFISVLLLLFVGWLINHKINIIPGKLQSIFELLIEQILQLMDSVFGDRRISERYFPVVTTVFLFILTSNWLGLLPIVGPIGLREVSEGHQSFIPLLRAPSADLNFTIALAIMAVFAVNFFSVSALGIRKYAGRFIHPKDPIMTGVGLLEIVSEFVKIVSFSFRLFGNVFAGEVLLLIVGFLVPLIVPLPFLFLEVFVGFIQAFIFAMLTMVFIAGAVAKTEH